MKSNGFSAKGKDFSTVGRTIVTLCWGFFFDPPSLISGSNEDREENSSSQFDELASEDGSVDEGDSIVSTTDKGLSLRLSRVLESRCTFGVAGADFDEALLQPLLLSAGEDRSEGGRGSTSSISVILSSLASSLEVKETFL